MYKVRNFFVKVWELMKCGIRKLITKNYDPKFCFYIEAEQRDHRYAKVLTDLRYVENGLTTEEALNCYNQLLNGGAIIHDDPSEFKVFVVSENDLEIMKNNKKTIPHKEILIDWIELYIDDPKFD